MEYSGNPPVSNSEDASFYIKGHLGGGVVYLFQGKEISDFIKPFEEN